MATALSQSDVDRLLSDPSSRTRVEVATNIARDLESPMLTDGEVQTAQEIIRLMSKDVEVAVRVALSNSLRHAKRLPHDVALAMANDVDAVAMPVLGASLVLTNDDLLEIVRRGSTIRQNAIAGRPSVPEPVSAALVSRGDETVVTTLMKNAGAKISEESLTRAIDRFPHSDVVKDSMARRQSLPITVTERLIKIVSDQLQDYLVAHHKLPPLMATDMALRSREAAMLHFSNGLGREHVEPLAAQMLANGRLTPSLVLRAVCFGDMPFFEAAIAVLADIPVANARILIHDAGPKGFEALYRKSGLPANLFAIFRTANEIIADTKFDGEDRDMERFRSKIITRLLTQLEDFPADDLDYLVDRLGDVLTPVRH
jgi:uncharacterized protein (DUF2336 family)